MGYGWLWSSKSYGIFLKDMVGLYGCVVCKSLTAWMIYPLGKQSMFQTLAHPFGTVKEVF